MRILQTRNSKHWFTTSFLGGRCRKAVLGVSHTHTHAHARARTSTHTYIRTRMRHSCTRPVMMMTGHVTVCTVQRHDGEPNVMLTRRLPTISRPEEKVSQLSQAQINGFRSRQGRIKMQKERILFHTLREVSCFLMLELRRVCF